MVDIRYRKSYKLATSRSSDASQGSWYWQSRRIGKAAVLAKPPYWQSRRIGKVAVFVGFDPSDMDRLMSLINAVRNVDAWTD